MMNRIVLITGAGGGIGSTTAKLFASKGDTIAVIDINEEAGLEVVNAINQTGGKARFYKTDITKPEEVKKTVEAVISDFGRIDVLINIAGGSARNKRALFYEQDEAVFKWVIEMNLYGTFYFCKYVAPYMIKNNYGRIINTSSAVGLNGHVKHSEYSAAKGATLSMSKSMAKEVGRYGITVNCVCPGMIPTQNVTKGSYEHTNYLHMTPSTDDVANAYLYLASDEARFITGFNLVVDGGRSLATKGTESDEY